MSVSIAKMTLPAALALIDHLRMLANHIERGGQSVYESGSVTVNVNNEIRERSEGFRQIASPTGAKMIALDADLTLRGVPSYAPRQGVQKFRSMSGRYYRWNGEPPRAPKRGETYAITNKPGDDMYAVKYAMRDLKTPRFIVQEYAS